ncbi:uncharacterized protein LOC141648728 [Silene latifolia]|uniref:uncharacterized protein LOC141648728 n=1 Tax=Silene latifolia TaxID=37657 RepID=UPI003D7858F0
MGVVSDSLWIAWNKYYTFKEKNIWTLSLNERLPASLKGILQARDSCLQLAGSVQQAKTLLQSCVSNGRFCLSKAYDILRIKNPKVSWAKLLSRPVIIPSHRLTLSLAIDNKLPTVDNMVKKGMALPNRCCLCKQAEENQSHLFFGCDYAKVVWNELLVWIGIHRAGMSLKREVGWISSRKRSKHWSCSWFICTLAATVHLLWHERNQRIFEGKERPKLTLVKHIKYIVGVRLLASSNDTVYNDIVEHLNS